MKPSQLFSHWIHVRDDLMTTIAMFDQEELVYTPFESSRPAGEVMLHIAEAEDGWFRYVVARELEKWPEHYSLSNFSTLPEIQSALRTVHKHTWDSIENLEEADLERMVETPWGQPLRLSWIVWHVLEHEIHHRGELSLILGLLGREGLEV